MAAESYRLNHYGDLKHPPLCRSGGREKGGDIIQYNSSQYLNMASTYIYVTKDTENTVASGFFFTFNDVNSVFLVTNRHVAMNAESFTISLCSSIEDASFGYIADVSNKVIFHPQDDIDLCLVRMDDLELVPENMSLDLLRIKCICENMVISQPETMQLNYCEDIIMFGAPHGIYDTKNSLSIAYRGMTATHAGTNWCGKAHFMIDIPSWPGLSGAAIYLCTKETMSSFENTRLLGIFYKSQYNPHSVPGNEEYIHLGKAIPAYKLLEFRNVI